MDLSNLTTRLKNDVNWLGAFTSEAGSNRLNSAVLSSALKIWNAKPWGWKYTSTTITTVDGTKGPYTAPTDFSGFATEQKTNKFVIGDLYTIYAIKPTDTDRFDVYYDEIQDAIFFDKNPGSGALTLGYLPSFDNILANVEATLIKFPESLYNIFEKLVPAHILDTPDSKSDSRALEAEGFALVEVEYTNHRRGVRKPTGLNPRDVNGNTYDNIGTPEIIHPFFGTQGV